MYTLSAPLARAIVRHHTERVTSDALDVGSVASVEVSSEQELYPVDHLFDGRWGRGASCWIAAHPGAQTVVLRFRAPHRIETVIVESEECAVTCAQQIEVACLGGEDASPFAAPPRVLHYSPYGQSFHHETWEIARAGVTQISFRVTPEPKGRLATLTAIIFRGAKVTPPSSSAV